MFVFLFEGNSFLRSVDLSFNGFGKEGAVALGQTLRENTVLEELNLRYEAFMSCLSDIADYLSLEFRRGDSLPLHFRSFLHKSYKGTSGFFSHCLVSSVIQT